MSYKFIAGLLLSALASTSGAQSPADITASPASTAYNQDNQGNIARSQYGLCWRTGYWTPTNSVTGCDGDLTPPISNPIAPALVSNPATLVNTEPHVATKEDNCNFAVTLSGDQTFGFGMTTLNDAANRTLSTEVVERLKTCSQIDRITVTGHADRLGSRKHIQEISLKRAEAVADFLKSKNISTPIEIAGAGNNEPISHCSEKLANKKLTSCLSPDRRVVISVQGHEK